MLVDAIGVENGAEHPVDTRRKQYPPAPCAAPLNVIGTHLAVGDVTLPPMHSLSATHARQMSTLPRDVVVHALVFGLQLLAPQAVSLAAVHWTH